MALRVPPPPPLYGVINRYSGLNFTGNLEQSRRKLNEQTTELRSSHARPFGCARSLYIMRARLQSVLTCVFRLHESYERSHTLRIVMPVYAPHRRSICFVLFWTPPKTCSHRNPLRGHGLTLEPLRANARAQQQKEQKGKTDHDSSLLIQQASRPVARAGSITCGSDEYIFFTSIGSCRVDVR